MTETPLSRYRALVQSGELKADPVQEQAALQLATLAQSLKGYAAKSGKKGFLGRLLGGGAEIPPPRGLYLYGGVGRGKSMLMNLFYEYRTQRLHKRSHPARYPRRNSSPSPIADV